MSYTLSVDSAPDKGIPMSELEVGEIAEVVSCPLGDYTGHCGTVVEAIRNDLEYRRVSYGGEGAWLCPCPLNGCDYRIECEEVYDAS